MKTQKQLDTSPQSLEEYPVDTYKVSGSADNADDAGRLGRDLAETLESFCYVDGSAITYGDGRWKGSTEFGFTVTISVPSCTHFPKLGVQGWTNRTEATLYVTKSVETAFEVF